MRTAALALRSVPRAALSLPPAWRRRVLVVLASLAVLGAAYWLWFRDSSFARVQEVYVNGVEGPQARAIRSAIEDAALNQTTLHVRPGALKAAVADYPVVRSVSAQGEFPHKLQVQVELYLPVGVLNTPSGRVPVASDGLLLRDVPVTGALPVLTAKTLLPSRQVTAGPAFALVHVVSAAPPALRGRIRSITYRRTGGIVAELRDGPELRFGDDTRIAAKWIAAARVLAAPAARGASYIDLRLPERPAAGGLPTTGVIPLAPAGDTITTVPAPAPAATPMGPSATPAAAPATTTAAAPTAAATPAQNTQPQVQTSPQPSTTP